MKTPKSNSEPTKNDYENFSAKDWKRLTDLLLQQYNEMLIRKLEA